MMATSHVVSDAAGTLLQGPSCMSINDEHFALSGKLWLYVEMLADSTALEALAAVSSFLNADSQSMHMQLSTFPPLCFCKCEVPVSVVL